MPERNEQDIIKGCLENTRAAQEQLYKQYYSVLLKTCARYTGDMHQAEQLLNDSFLKIFTQIKTYKGTGSFEGWMKRITVNTCLDHLKSKDLKTAMQMHVNSDLVTEAIITTTNEAMSRMEFKELLVMIQSLPATTRTVFNLFVFDGYSHKEIAGMLAISEGTSYWHVNQARTLLQKHIQASKKTMYEHKRI
ncbi:RNA polymerase sigma factor [Chitinophagaceae bacterium MMS25-I14]